MEDLIGKVAIITGGSGEIGRAIALELGGLGASIVICYNNDEEGANKTLSLLKEKGSYGILAKGNISKASHCKRIVEETIKAYGKIDILVNNAGVAKIGLFMDESYESIEDLIGINLLSAMYMSKYALSSMLSTGGSIINISSIWGEVGASCEVVYSAAKGGINTFTKALAKEMGPSNIRVNAVAPGVINTKMNSMISEDDKKDLIEDIPLNEIGTPKDVAKTVGFLCSSGGRYITGEIIRVDGGFGR